jgi:hypothetical protein
MNKLAAWFRRQKPEAVPSDDEELTREVDEIRRQAGQGLINLGWFSRTMLHPGEHMSRTLAAAFDPDGPRTWEEGEDESRLLQAVLASRGERLIMQTVPETGVQISILNDNNKTLNWGERYSKLFQGGIAAATVALCADRMGDTLAYWGYANDSIVKRIRPSAPRHIIRQILRSALRPPASSGRMESGLDLALKTQMNLQSQVIIISDCLNLTEGQKALMKKLARQRRLRVLVIEDPRERSLPDENGPLEVFDLRTRRTVTWLLNDHTRAQYRADFLAHEARLHAFFTSKPNIPYATLITGQSDENIGKIKRLLTRTR